MAEKEEIESENNSGNEGLSATGDKEEKILGDIRGAANIEKLLDEMRNAANVDDEPEDVESAKDVFQGDDGWDETESLSRRLQSLQTKQLSKPDDPGFRGSTRSSSTTSKQESSEKGDDEGDTKEEFSAERKEETKDRRPNIWKELDKMQSTARGGSKGNFGTRFSKHGGDDSSWEEDRFSRGRGGGRGGSGGQGKWPRANTREEYDQPPRFKVDTSMGQVPITKGFDSIRPSGMRNTEGPFSRQSTFPNDSGSFRNRRGDTTRGRMVQGRGFASINDAVSRRGGKPAYLNRQVDEDYDRPDGGESGFGAARNPPQISQNPRQRDHYSDQELEHPKRNERNAYWLVEADDADLVAGYQRSRAQYGTSARENAVFEPLKKALDTFDQSNRAAKQIQSLVTQLAEEYCQQHSDRWLKLVDQYLMAYAIDHAGGHSEITTTAFVRLIDSSSFQKAAYISLMRHISDLMAPHEWTEEDHREARNLCDLFGRLLVSSWPPGWDSCAKECNMVIYAIMNAVQTWLQALENASTRGAAARASVSQASAICLCHLATSTGRKLWLKWPDFVDQVYATLRSVIVSQVCCLDEDTKLQLLDLYVKLNEWPKPVGKQAAGTAPRRDTATQTDGASEGPVTGAVQSTRMSRPSAFDTVGSRGRGDQQRFSREHPTFRAIRPDSGFVIDQYQRQQQRPTSFHSSAPPEPRFPFTGMFGKQL